MLEVEGLSAWYGHVEALRHVNLHVDDGELIAVLGPNGAGKSTLMRALLGLVPTEGRVRFCGADVPRGNPVGAAACGLILVPEGRGIFGPMTVAENLELGAYLLAAAAPSSHAGMSAYWRCFRVSRSDWRRSPARYPAASSRCWRSAGH